MDHPSPMRAADRPRPYEEVARLRSVPAIAWLIGPLWSLTVGYFGVLPFWLLLAGMLGAIGYGSLTIETAETGLILGGTPLAVLVLLFIGGHRLLIRTSRIGRRRYWLLMSAALIGPAVVFSVWSGLWDSLGYLNTMD